MNPSKWAVLALAALMALAVPLAVSAAPAQKSSAATAIAARDVTRATNRIADIPIRGTTAAGDVFRGQLDLLRFKVVDGALLAVGDLSGTLRNAAGNVIGSVTDQRVRLPVAFGAVTSCDILRLRLGPLDLDLLGLQVHLDRVVLDITAQPGPGNLLGNLLCAVAGLLDRGLNLNGVLRDLLNAVLGVLRL
jgi:hypothetical protein